MFTMEASGIHASLCNHVILNVMFDYLKLEDLKQCRLVVKLWDDLATPFLLKNCVVALNAEETESLVKLREWMMSPLWSAPSSQRLLIKIPNFKSINCDSITHDLYPNLIRTNILGTWIRSLTVSHWWGNERDLTLADYEDLLLRRCPNLEEINIPVSHKFKAPNAAHFLLGAGDKENKIKLRLKTIIVTGLDDEPDMRFWRILALSPELKSFKVTCLINEEFWKPRANLHFNAVNNLESLEVRSYGNDSVTSNSSNYFCEAPWPKLTSLTVEWHSPFNPVMRQCSDHVGKTVTYFHVVLFNTHCLPWLDLEFDLDNWMIPKSMTELESFVLEIDDLCDGPIFSRTLIASIFLPKLKSLRMKVYDDEDHNEDDWPSGLFSKLMMHTKGLVNEAMRPLRAVRAWNRTINPARATGHLRRESFNVLELPPKFKDVSCIERLLDFYPNLSELTLKHPDESVVENILKLWTQLERLTLGLKEEGDINWTKVLIGSGESNSGRLADMKKMQALDLKLIGKNQSNADDDQAPLFPFTDALIFEGLIFLPNVQHVLVQGHLISPKAIEALRHAALPFCYIDIA